MREDAASLLKVIADGTRFPILAFVEPLLYGAYQRDDFAVSEAQAFRAVKECGIDMIVGAQYCLSKDGETVHRILKQCEEQELLYLVRDGEGFADRTEAEAESYFRKAYAPLMRYRSFAGINAADEPGYCDWDKVRKFRRAFSRIYPDRLYFVNLLQNYAPAWALPNGAENRGGLAPDTDYGFYCESYCKQAEPDRFCYDFYPFRGDYPTVKAGYFDQLETVLRTCRRRELPIWCFLQSCAFPEFGTFARVPSYEEMLWQVNTSLCYGTKGFAYFCYWIPYDDANWFGAFTDIRGNKTGTYENGKRVNAYLRSVGDVFLRSRICRGLRAGNECVFEPFDRLRSVRGDVVVSCLRDETNELLFVVNESFEKETVAELTVSCPVTAYRARTEEPVFKNGTVTVRLQKGEGRLFLLAKE